MQSELAALYDLTAMVAPRRCRAPEYADYAVWQQHLQGEILERLLLYWKQKLAGAPASGPSPDRPRPPLRFSWRCAVVYVPKMLSEDVARTSRQLAALLSLTLLAAFSRCEAYSARMTWYWARQLRTAIILKSKG